MRHSQTFTGSSRWLPDRLQRGRLEELPVGGDHQEGDQEQLREEGRGGAGARDQGGPHQQQTGGVSPGAPVGK